jgi:hypothetical protein
MMLRTRKSIRARTVHASSKRCLHHVLIASGAILLAKQ